MKEELETQLIKSQQENDEEEATASPIKGKVMARPSHNDSHPEHDKAGLYYA